MEHDEQIISLLVGLRWLFLLLFIVLMAVYASASAQVAACS